jgi:hypothetical protein
MPRAGVIARDRGERDLTVVASRPGRSVVVGELELGVKRLVTGVPSRRIASER